MAMFDELHIALTAQMRKLQEAERLNAEDRKFVIEQSKAVEGLAGRIIGNANTAIRLIEMQSMDGVNPEIIESTTPKLLKG